MRLLWSLPSALISSSAFCDGGPGVSSTDDGVFFPPASQDPMVEYQPRDSSEVFFDDGEVDDEATVEDPSGCNSCCLFL
eukprot:CAMPEP_0185267934 /NCGR_PEP_ID=MMETSP1359-20130426/35673_1 /TAXON_ID=552665 /ORGANISM="Bigelowiella longifila, Strain CCMP242" /LENGTH=78 /DNA_ID=CAMNT_0027858487 /DNA_START=546 /DNA_END=782 /DNA_ORIENTATION=-